VILGDDPKDTTPHVVAAMTIAAVIPRLFTRLRKEAQARDVARQRQGERHLEQQQPNDRDRQHPPKSTSRPRCVLADNAIGRHPHRCPIARRLASAERQL